MNAPASPKTIIVEGPIGVGKTSLANLLSKEMKARLVLEKAEENPFLRSFYKDPEQYAFQTQLFFLLSRYRQMEALFQIDLFEEIAICDYFLPKDRIFASLTLKEEELALYEQIYNLLKPRAPVPDLVVYLQATPEVLLDRITQRGRDFEKEISPEYLTELIHAYNRFFFSYDESPLLIIQTQQIDFVKNRAELEDLVRQIRQMGKGMQYYIPMSSREPQG